MKLKITAGNGPSTTKVYFDGVEQKNICALNINIDARSSDNFVTATFYVDELDLSEFTVKPVEFVTDNDG